MQHRHSNISKGKYDTELSPCTFSKFELLPANYYILGLMISNLCQSFNILKRLVKHLFYFFCIFFTINTAVLRIWGQVTDHAYFG